MRLTASTEIDRIEKPEDQPRFISMALNQIAQILNNGLGFSDNFNAKTLTISFSAANTDVATIHGLGRVPTGYIVIGSSAATSVYDGASANTASLLYLRASAATTVKVLVF
jgi:hypothetical protein